MAKDNTILVRLDDEEERILNDGWFSYVSWRGRPVTKSEYIRECLIIMKKYLDGEVSEHGRTNSESA